VQKWFIHLYSYEPLSCGFNPASTRGGVTLPSVVTFVFGFLYTWVHWGTGRLLGEWPYLLTYLLTYSMVQDIIWKADYYSAEMLRSYQRISPGPRHFETFRNDRNIFTVRGCWPHAQPPSWKTTPCRLSATAYSIYSQLLSVPGGLTSIHNLRMHHAVVTRGPPNMVCEWPIQVMS
jgi:hypothetical protein